jgi:hypothetical protein
LCSGLTLESVGPFRSIITRVDVKQAEMPWQAEAVFSLIKKFAA